MSFTTTAKDARASERFMLVRMTPARLVSLSLASIGGGQYTLSFPYPIARVERNGVALTSDGTTTPTVNDHYSFTESTQAFQVKLASSPDETTNLVVVYYYLFYTGHRESQAYHTPTDSATTLRSWQPKIVNYPTIHQSFKNILSGIFSIDNNTIELINTDREFEAYLGPNDSFNAKDVDMWLCIDDTSQMTKVYTGKVNAVTSSQTSVRFSFYDAFSRLDQSAYNGDTSGEAYFQRSSSSFPNLDPSFNLKPCPLILGKFSPYNLTTAQVTYSPYYRLDPNVCLPGVCTSFSPNLSTSTNRTWGLCRTPAGGLRNPVFPVAAASFVNNSAVTQQLTEVIWTHANYANTSIEVGDNVKLVDGAISHYARVIALSDDGTYNHVMFVTDNVGAAPAYTTALVITPYPIALVFTVSSVDYYPLHTRDYSVTQTTTSGGNTYVSITFVNNFEANISGFPAALDPNNHKMHFRISVATTSLNHSDVLSSLCTGAGLTVDSTTFAAAKAALAVNTYFMIPMMGETEYSPYRTYVEKLLSSTLGYVSLTTANTVQYNLLAAPTGTAVVDNNLILNGSLSVDIDYNDVVSEIVASNAHYANITALDATSPAARTVSSLKAQYLHGIVRSNRFDHILESISGRIAALLSLQSTRRVIYSFDTATNNLDTVLGDQLLLTTSRVLGGGGSQALQVVGAARGVQSVTLEASDLKDL